MNAPRKHTWLQTRGAAANVVGAVKITTALSASTAGDRQHVVNVKQANYEEGWLRVQQHSDAEQNCRADAQLQKELQLMERESAPCSLTETRVRS